mmetsp:Transcript_49066/g.151521  ORF Transcript_49066/g.151521 Transcript_49066/m.151521 type:complete len:221 (-) Transcript_49066:146-808(-)|eukprot:CAMPEP_0174849454 /NCGR_PEP_ID=MMETSP1114-20130205/16041_1 /TAXON_ID=312471 /ORGANISM="Neobodo designis, Strain CCAP 1951/1" /LENGTH=220 /DNA_ID=CAMNT_0016083797 /DNA_START=323 /DNA_END=985 /DNA_ORIENTATION=-
MVESWQRVRSPSGEASRDQMWLRMKEATYCSLHRGASVLLHAGDAVAVLRAVDERLVAHHLVVDDDVAAVEVALRLGGGGLPDEGHGSGGHVGGRHRDVVQPEVGGRGGARRREVRRDELVGGRPRADVEGALNEVLLLDAAVAAGAAVAEEAAQLLAAHRADRGLLREAPPRQRKGARVRVGRVELVGGGRRDAASEDRGDEKRGEEQRGDHAGHGGQT